MTALTIRSFTGMIPKIPAERLPDGAAEYAKNCQFGMGGELRSMWGPGPKHATSTAVRSIFTDNGSRFYTWPTYTRAYLSPTIDDNWRRVYFNVEAGGLRLTSTDPIGGLQGMRDINNNPGPPSWSLKVGVRPPSSLTATKSQDVNAYFWAQALHDGVVVKDTALTAQPFEEVVEWSQYRVTVDAALLSFPVSAPVSPTEPAVVESYRFWLKLVNKNDGAVRFDGPVSHVSEGSSRYLLSVPQTASGRAVTVAYVATMENNVGEESSTTNPVTVETRDNGMFSVSAVVTLNLDPDQILPNKINLYRTYPGSTAYFLVEQLPYVPAQNAYTFTDRSTSTKTAITLSSNQAEWDEPPANLHSLTYAGNGIFCGATGKDLCFSEPYRPHAWPYRMIFPNTITGVVEVEGGALVTTTTKPYFVFGTHPAAMTQQSMAADQAGFSAKSMARVEGSAIYAGYDGLVIAKGGQASIDYSKQLFDQYLWRKVGFIDSLPYASLAAWDGRLFYVHDGTAQPDFIFTLTGEPYVVEFDAGSDLTGVGISATTDTTYLLYSDGFAANARGGDFALPLTWHSKVFTFPSHVGFACGIVNGEGNFSIVLRCDDVDIHTEPISTLHFDHRFRLPPARGKRWQIKISGTGGIRSIELGTSFAELKNV